LLTFLFTAKNNASILHDVVFPYFVTKKAMCAELNSIVLLPI
jgi:hypothetical protein